MFAFLLALWIVFNGRLTAETFLLGLVFAAAVFAFLCRFSHYSIQTEKKVIRLTPLTAQYLGVLVVEIVRSTFGACRFILSRSVAPQPMICRFRTELKSEAAQVMLANSITLTPGTITVSLDHGLYTVHCLDRSMAEGLDSSRFVQLLSRMEEVAG